uniref:Uncharacterized protein n=1 Tax=Hanusia phi TaxID=3032 RepID=A0A7S0EC16_9CRYP|mmetsp:Transcript_20731/g.46914  ORF Transcript_20731/g.46914 Transcript_20731/m.46914 type:complete len:308 (+) Transcript_20731:241-1164(+)
MSSARNLTSQVQFKDGSAPADNSKPKPPRPSVCMRSTAASAETRKKVATRGKNSEVLTTGGKFIHDKTIEGSTSKKMVTERSESEKVKDVIQQAATLEASKVREQAKEKAGKCESDGVLFDKKQSRKSMWVSESKRAGVRDTAALNQTHEQSDTQRKKISQRDHSSTVFSSGDAMEHRPLRVMNIKADKPQPPQKQQSAAEIKFNAELNALSQGSENQRRMNATKQHNSSIFASDGDSKPLSRPATSGGRVSSNIFSGGAYAEDAAKTRTVTRDVPTLATSCVSAGGGMESARARRDQALRGSGSLW